MKLNEFSNDKQLDEVLPALALLGRLGATAGSAALRGAGTAASAIGKGLATGAKAVGQGLVKGAGNLAGQAAGSAAKGFAKTMTGGTSQQGQQDQQLTTQQQKQLQQQELQALKSQDDLTKKIKDIETALTGMKQATGIK